MITKMTWPPVAARSLLLAALGSTLLLAGCEKKELLTHEELYGGSLLLTADWQGQEHTAATLDVALHSLTAGVAADTAFRMPGADASVKLTLQEARYGIIALHGAENVRFDGECFRLETSASPAGSAALPAGTSAPLLPEPGAFSAGTGVVDARAQESQTYTLKLYPFTRLLTLSFGLDAGAGKRVAGMDAMLSGIAASRRVADRNTAQDGAGSIRLEMRMKLDATAGEPEPWRFSRTRADDGEDIVYLGKHRLLGVHTGERQVLTLVLNYTNGESETLVEDVTGQLSGFNEGGMDGEGQTGLTLTAHISIAGQPGASATIIDWQPGTDSDLDAGNE